MDQLASVWMEDLTTEATRISINKKIDSFVEGDLEHATEILSALWEIANNDDDIKAPSKKPTVVSQVRFFFSVVHGSTYSRNQATKVTSPARWDSVKIALIKSMRTGVFFDRKYWARYSKSGDVLKPVYFSSIIMSDKAQELNNCVLKSGYGFAEALSVPSGKTPQGAICSHKLSGGRRQYRQRL
jgi:hypothetical protein